MRDQSPRLTRKAEEEIEQSFDNTKEAHELLGLIAAEFQSDPMSVQCFDLGVVDRVLKNVELRERLVKSLPFYML